MAILYLFKGYSTAIFKSTYSTLQYVPAMPVIHSVLVWFYHDIIVVWSGDDVCPFYGRAAPSSMSPIKTNIYNK